MKLVIQTQYAENYGAHDWNGEGACPQYWKNKGGATYVVENLTLAQERKILVQGIPMLTELLSRSNEYSSERILGHSIQDDSEQVCEEWEAPVILGWDRAKNAWVAHKYTPRDIGWKAGYTGKTEVWQLAPNGERVGYSSEFHKELVE